MKYICLVCGYPDLRSEPTVYSDVICPCCETHFGRDDVGTEPPQFYHRQLREKWNEAGRPFKTESVKPEGWGDEMAMAQIYNLWTLAVQLESQPYCHDCNVGIGQSHISGCDEETCVLCGGQYAFCDCKRRRPRRLPWRGRSESVITADEQELFCYRKPDPRFMSGGIDLPCSRRHKGAQIDYNAAHAFLGGRLTKVQVTERRSRVEGEESEQPQ